MVSDMEYVCEDTSDTKWMYDRKGDTYYRMYPDRKYTKIRRQSIPDPEELLSKKIAIATANGQRPQIPLLKSTPAVYALWNHAKLVDKELKRS